jgi:hypothetical protein
LLGIVNFVRRGKIVLSGLDQARIAKKLCPIEATPYAKDFRPAFGHAACGGFEPAASTWSVICFALADAASC